MEIYYTKESKKDIRNILKYIVEDNPETVARLSDKIKYTCDLLLSMPGIGTDIKSIVEVSGLASRAQKNLSARSAINSIRKFSVVDFDKFLIFYRIKKDRVVVIRILHSSRDIPIIFEEINS